MRVLVACEESQRVCIAFREKGHEAYSCDIEPCSGGHPEWHIQDDVLKHLNENWDLIIAHPPCYERLNTLKYAVLNGIENISISCEPMLDKSCVNLIQTALEFGCDIWFGLANGFYEKGMPKITDDWVQMIINTSKKHSFIKLKDSLSGKRGKND